MSPLLSCTFAVQSLVLTWVLPLPGMEFKHIKDLSVDSFAGVKVRWLAARALRNAWLLKQLLVL